MDRALLPAIAAFACVARVGSFTRAAAELGVSASALSQTIRFLESQLGLRLLNRSTRSVSATEDGHKLLDGVAPALEAIKLAVASVQDRPEHPAGAIRIKSPQLAATQFIEPFLGEFNRRNPGISLDIVIDDSFGDLANGGFDAGIQLRRYLCDGVVAVPVGPASSMALVGSPAYFQQNPPPASPHDLKRHNCLGCRMGSQGLLPWEFSRPGDGQTVSMTPSGTLVTNSDETMIRAALQGMGLVQHFEFVVQDHLRSGALVRVLKDWCPPSYEFCLYFPARDHMAPKLRALVDFLSDKRRIAAARAG